MYVIITATTQPKYPTANESIILYSFTSNHYFYKFAISDSQSIESVYIHSLNSDHAPIETISGAVQKCGDQKGRDEIENGRKK